MPRPKTARLTRFVIGLSVILAAGAPTASLMPSPALAAGERPAAAPTASGFFSQDRFVRLEVIRGEGDGPRPTVIMLHGAGGVGGGALIYPKARALAERGMSAFIVNYFDGLGPRAKGGRSAPRLHNQRDRVIADALAHVRARPDVDPERIGVFGLSLGGFHALHLASRDSGIAAVVNMFGAMPAPVARQGLVRMPPTLILHGDRDRVVPVRRAYELARLLDRSGVPYELQIYRGQGHNFQGGALADSVRKTVDFFDRYLTLPAAAGT